MRFPVECPHSLCEYCGEYCGECHDVECDLVQKLCLILFLETFLQEKLQEKISEEEREVYRVLNSSLLSDDITLEDLEQFSFLYIKMFPRKQRHRPISAFESG